MRKNYIKSSKLSDPSAEELVERFLRKENHEYFHSLSKTRKNLTLSILVGRKMPDENGSFVTTHALILLGHEIDKFKSETSERLAVFQEYREDILATVEKEAGNEVSRFIVVRVWRALQEI